MGLTINDIREYLVIVGFENGENNLEHPVVDLLALQDCDVKENYEWADEERSILRPKKLIL